MATTLDVYSGFDAWKSSIEEQELPAGYTMDEDYTWYCQPNKEDATPFPVCGPVVVVARVRDDRSDEWGRIIRHKTPDGGIKTRMVTDDLLHESSSKVVQNLARGGLHVATGKVAHDALKRLLNGLEAEVHVYAKQSGWQKNPDGQEVFVLPSGEVIGGGGVLMRPDSIQPLCVPSCTNAEWQENVAKYAIGNSRLLLAISVPFAAPLLYDTSIGNGGMHLIGPSQIAKTTGVMVGASVIGAPVPVPDGVMASWSNTSNAMEGVTARANDMALPLDEMSQAQPNQVAAIVYAIGNGAGKGRMRADSSLRDTYKWRTLVLSTGEERAEDKAAQSTGPVKRMNAGVDVRLANVPADTAKYGVFENLHGFGSNGELAKHLVRNVRKYYASALPEFLREYTKLRNMDKVELVRYLNEEIAAWIRTHVPAEAGSQVRSVANRFALAAVAGEMAAGMGVVPWAAGEAANGVGVCLRAWMDERGDLGMAEDKAILMDLKSWLQGHQFSNFVDNLKFPDRATSQEIYGVRREDPKGGVDFWVFDDHLKKIMPGRNPTTVARVLDKAGYLIRETGRTTYKHRYRETGGVVVQTYRIDGRLFEYDPDR